VFESLEKKLAARRLARCFSIADLRRLTKRRLPRPIFGYMDGAADDEVTYRRNSAAFGDYDLHFRSLVDISEVDLSTTVLGKRIDMPIILSPTGLTRLFHHDGERAVAPAAARAGTIYSLSTMSSVSIEDVAAASPGPKWFQIYVFKDRGLLTEFFDRCRASGYHAMCLTVDVPVPGNRERDLRFGLSVPPEIRASTVLDAALRPSWSWHYLTSPAFSFVNVAHRAPGGDLGGVMKYISNQFDPTVTWDDARWMIEQWNGPFLIKGIVRPDDAKRAVEIGAQGIIISNHGGRQLDYSPAPLDVLSSIVDAVGDDAEVLLDGGIRRGTDVVKALALGARACMIGRAYLYGLGAGGEAGVDRALHLLRSELTRDMQLLGARSIAEIDSSFVQRRAG
jgi:L-lactate dehydrogenase (cytochrome)